MVFRSGIGKLLSLRARLNLSVHYAGQAITILWSYSKFINFRIGIINEYVGIVFSNGRKLEMEGNKEQPLKDVIIIFIQLYYWQVVSCKVLKKYIAHAQSPLSIERCIGTLWYNQKMTFDPEIQPNVPENCQISALFRTLISPKCLGIIQ